jgi:hypothetical protein
MQKLPKLGCLVALNKLDDTPLWRVVEHVGKFGVGIIDATIEHNAPNQKVQYMDSCYFTYPTLKQFQHFTHKEPK